LKNILFVLTLFLVSSCEHNNDEIVAGKINRNVNYTELSPAKQIISPGKDSLDLDGNSQYDIVFYKSAVPLLTGFGITAEILKKSSILIIMDADNKYPACLNYKDVINSSSKWSGTDQTRYVLQSYKCGTEHCPLIGNFADVTDKYLAFKAGDNYGWIQLNNSVGGALTIKGYVISK
jgi:hypothetical protein